MSLQSFETNVINRHLHLSSIQSLIFRFGSGRVHVTLWTALVLQPLAELTCPAHWASALPNRRFFAYAPATVFPGYSCRPKVCKLFDTNRSGRSSQTFGRHEYNVPLNPLRQG